MPTEDNLTDEQREALAMLADKVPDEEALIPVTTAFAVIIGQDGEVSLDPDLVKGVKVDRSPGNHDVIGALASLQNEFATNLSAMKTVTFMQRQAVAMQQQMQQQAQFQQVQSLLNKGSRG